MYFLSVGISWVKWITAACLITLPITYPPSNACVSMSCSLFLVPFTGQTGVTPPASKPPAWMALDATSLPIPISFGPMVSPLTMLGIVCTGWMLSTMSSRGPIWTGVTARLSLARVRPFLHSPLSLILLSPSWPPGALAEGEICAVSRLGPRGHGRPCLGHVWTEVLLDFPQASLTPLPSRCLKTACTGQTGTPRVSIVLTNSLARTRRSFATNSISPWTSIHCTPSASLQVKKKKNTHLVSLWCL